MPASIHIAILTIILFGVGFTSGADSPQALAEHYFREFLQAEFKTESRQPLRARPLGSNNEPFTAELKALQDNYHTLSRDTDMLISELSGIAETIPGSRDLLPDLVQTKTRMDLLALQCGVVQKNEELRNLHAQLAREIVQLSYQIGQLPNFPVLVRTTFSAINRTMDTCNNLLSVKPLLNAAVIRERSLLTSNSIRQLSQNLAYLEIHEQHREDVEIQIRQFAGLFTALANTCKDDALPFAIVTPFQNAIAEWQTFESASLRQSSQLQDHALGEIRQQITQLETTLQLPRSQSNGAITHLTQQFEDLMEILAGNLELRALVKLTEEERIQAIHETQDLSSLSAKLRATEDLKERRQGFAKIEQTWSKLSETLIPVKARLLIITKRKADFYHQELANALQMRPALDHLAIANEASTLIGLIALTDIPAEPANFKTACKKLERLSLGKAPISGLREQLNELNTSWESASQYLKKGTLLRTTIVRSLGRVSAALL